MPLVSKKGATGTEGLGARIECSDDGGARYHRLRGGDNTSYAPGDRESGTTPTYDGVVSFLGPETIGDLTLSFPAWNPNLQAWRVVANAKRDNADLLWRIRTVDPITVYANLAARTGQLAAYPDPVPDPAPPGSVFSVTAPASGTPAVRAARLAVDALFTGDVIKYGHVIFIEGDRWRTIEDIEVDDDVAPGVAGRWRAYVTPEVAAATPAAADQFVIQTPAYQWDFMGGVKNFNSFTLPASGTLGTTLTVTPNSPLDLAALRNENPTF